MMKNSRVCLSIIMSLNKRNTQNLEASLKINKNFKRVKSPLFSMASHEFRTPLSAILSSGNFNGKQNESGMKERR